MHTLSRIQNLPLSVEKAWDFFSSPENLREITPPGMEFRILSDIPDQMYPGQIIMYRVKPLLGIPIKWVTEISHLREKEYFVDVQLSGPYAKWHHEHRFRGINGGVEMKDILYYQLPLGIVGRFIHWLGIRKKINQIFDYRYRILEKKFGSFDDQN